MYHYADGDVSRGPVSRDALRGKITAQTLVWREGMAEWVPAGTLPELADLLPPSTPVAPHSTPVAPQSAPYNPPPPAPQPAYTPVAQPVHHHHYSSGPTPMQYQTPTYGQQAPGAAVASMVLGIVGILGSCLYGLGIICAILAIIFGHVARSNGAVGNNPGAGMAVAGIVMGWVMVALCIVGFLIFFVAIAASA